MHDFDLAAHGLRRPGLRPEPLVCIECQRPWLDPTERWRVYVLEEEPPEAVPYCDVCAAREFGPWPEDSCPGEDCY